MVSKDKLLRLWGAFQIEARKRIPYVIAVFAILLLYLSITTGAKVAENGELAKENSQHTRELAESNKVLLEELGIASNKIEKLSEDNKKLSEQTIRLADQSIRYQECTFKLFAKFTRERQPIQDFDLNTCTVENIFFGNGTTSVGNPPSSQPTAKKKPSAQREPSRIDALPPKAQESFIDRAMKIPKGLLKSLQSIL